MNKRKNRAMEVKTTSTYCRLCFLQVTDYINIFESQTINILDMLKHYFHDVVRDSDIFPKVICRECWHRVEEFHRFSQEVIELREEYLQKHLNHTIKNEDYEESDIPNDEPEINQDIEIVDPLRPIKMEIDDSIDLSGNKLYYELTDEEDVINGDDDDEDDDLYDDIFEVSEDSKDHTGWHLNSENGNSSVNGKDNQKSSRNSNNLKDASSFFGQVHECACKRQCASHINIARQREIFTEYHGIQSWSLKTIFLRTLVEQKKCYRKDVNPINKLKKKDNMYSYFLRDDQGVKHQVCLTFILKLLQVNRTKIYRSIISGSTNPSAVDRRGKCGARAANVQDAEFLTNFIDTFPQYESRYNKSQTKYLHPDLSVKKLHEIYQAHCITDGRKPLTLSYFQRTYDKFNTVFAKRRTQTCWICNKLESKQKKSVISTETRTKLGQKKQEHCDNAGKIVNDFENEIQKARESMGTEIFTFGLGPSIGLPHILPIDYTKRRLWLHEFCIFDEIRRLSYVYIWPESIASKGSQEIASCIIRHLQTTLSPQTERLLLYCDPNFGQNRNINLSLVLQHFLNSWPHPHLISIQQKFFTSGHGFNNCDRSFEEIKKKEKSLQMIFVPSQRINSINQLGKTIWKISATEMRAEHFYATKTLENVIASKTIAADGQKINWQSYHSITYNRAEPFILHIKRYDDTTLDIILRKQNVHDQFSNIIMPKLYPNGRNISKIKYNDLQELIDQVPNKFRTFYGSFKYVNSNVDKDYVFSARESSDEEDEDVE